jgi:hypothetical protein
MDLSKNSLYGTTPHCFHNMTFGRLVVDDPVYNEYPSMSWFERVVSTFQKLLEWNSEGDNMEAVYNEQIKDEFVTKYRLTPTVLVISLIICMDWTCHAIN